MKALLTLAALALAAGLLFVSTGPASAEHSEQVVFSGTGGGNFNGTDTGFGFWIWCEADSANPYVGACNGAMYFYALGIVKHVSGGVFESPDGIYNMSVAASDGSVACSLHNMSATVNH